MTKLVLGPTGTQRRRWTLFAPFFIVALVGLMLAAGAQAVHDDGFFELDRNATNDAAVAGDDWNQVFLGTDNADVSQFQTDDAEIYTGGATKDDLDIPGWRHTAGNVPDKDELLHGYAARYDDHLYFGADRFANNGDAVIGIWFFQSNVGPIAGGGFSGQHINGDVLVLSDFTKGGETSTIRVFQWHSPGGEINGTLDLIFGTTATPSDCVASPLPPNDPACATVNAASTPSPWPFTPKSGPSGSFAKGEFYEGGIDLGALDLADECFSSVILETRSSQSVDAVLKDFVAEPFQTCQPSMTTQASASLAAPVTPGTAVTDTATVQIQGAANPTDPTGTVTFFLCPFATGGCAAGGTNIGTGTLNGGAVTNDGTATATSPAVNTSGSPLAPGSYCFRAEWPGDTNYTGTTHTNDTTECFRVKDTSTISTNQRWLPQDSATVTTAGGTPVSGTVVFTLYENGTCSGTGVTFTDTDGSDGYSTNNTTYRTLSSTISWSATFTPSDPDAVVGSTTTRCERSDLTINNSASNFPPSP
jgi:hypothetical protein